LQQQLDFLRSEAQTDLSADSRLSVVEEWIVEEVEPEELPEDKDN